VCIPVWLELAGKQAALTACMRQQRALHLHSHSHPCRHAVSRAREHLAQPSACCAFSEVSALALVAAGPAVNQGDAQRACISSSPTQRSCNMPAAPHTLLLL
jgi:hypothetical protein